MRWGEGWRLGTAEFKELLRTGHIIFWSKLCSTVLQIPLLGLQLQKAVYLPNLRDQRYLESKQSRAENFRGGLVVKPLHFQCGRHEFSRWSWTLHARWSSQKENRKEQTKSGWHPAWGGSVESHQGARGSKTAPGTGPWATAELRAMAARGKGRS